MQKKSPYKPIPLYQDLKISHLFSMNYRKIKHNFMFGGEAHDFWELVYVDQGQLQITAGGKQYLLKAGELAFHKPGEYHDLRAVGITAHAIIVAFACRDSCMKFFEHRFVRLATQDREYLFEALRHRDSMNERVTVGSPLGGAQLVRANLELLLIQLIQKANSIRIQERIESYEQMHQIQLIVERVDVYLQEHIAERLTLKKIAIDLGYSVSQAKRLYHHKTGKGIIDTFIGFKMEEARRLLQEGKMSISQVAVTLGYDDPAYFTRLFKKRFDMTPSECSRSFKEEK